ncbi:hypothetical protein [Marinicrinis sediminis]|uniref:Uncharacterized protein n=1 Tax=Marinicrinis sediminis TaxID=1652465 RepID=A0ABW5RA55_9BACL
MQLKLNQYLKINEFLVADLQQEVIVDSKFKTLVYTDILTKDYKGNNAFTIPCKVAQANSLQMEDIIKDNYCVVMEIEALDTE